MPAKVIKIYSKNNEYQHLEVIKNNRKKRSKNKEFFVEGAKSISNLVANNWNIVSLAYSTDKKMSSWGEDILKSSNAEKYLELPIELMRELSDKDEDYSEILAVVTMPEDNLDNIEVLNDSIVVVIDRPSNYGNLGTLLRSCEGLAVAGVIVSGHAVDLYDVKTIRASLGTMFSIPVVRVESHSQVKEWVNKLKKKNPSVQVVGTTSATEMMVDEANFLNPTVLLIGNETKGLSHKYVEMCDVMVKIPMYGKITSFNVSCAASIMLYEANRQKRCKN